MSINLNFKLTHGKAVVIGWVLWAVFGWFISGVQTEAGQRESLITLYIFGGFCVALLYTLIVCSDKLWHKQIGGDE